jgi:hypothetical protein
MRWDVWGLIFCYEAYQRPSDDDLFGNMEQVTQPPNYRVTCYFPTGENHHG